MYIYIISNNQILKKIFCYRMDKLNEKASLQPLLGVS